jgi:hypothetical protein
LLGNEQIKDAIHEVKQGGFVFRIAFVDQCLDTGQHRIYIKEEAIPVLCRLGNGLTEFPPMFCNSTESHTPQGRGG